MALPQRSKLSVADLRDPTRFSKSAYIEALYRVLLQREPDPSGLQAYSRRDDTQNFFQEILGSREFKAVSRNTAYFSGNRDNRTRILLFGAYGNGNLGDAIQAISLLRAIRNIRQDVEVWACSQLPCQFPFPFEYVLPAKEIYNVSLLNQFALMIIGGGGLLSHPHDPLTNEDWQNAIDVPVVLFGIGAGDEIVSKCKTLITKAVYVSGRDEPSLAALRRFREGVRFVPDPVLADPGHHLNRGGRRRHRMKDRNRLWILKNTQNVDASELKSTINPDEDEICFIEPFLDFPLVQAFPRAQAVYFANDLISLIDRSESVVSMRYHGCILAMLRSRPVVGLYEQKSLDLLARYDLGRFFSASGTTIPDTSNFTTPNDEIIRDQEIFRKELTAVLSLLPPMASAVDIEGSTRSRIRWKSWWRSRCWVGVGR
jgi:polysaccharide pyruvyl transferase WcaK-like protein